MRKSNIIKVLVVLLVVGVLVFMFTGCSKIDENILKTDSNGIFKYTSYTDLSKNFTLKSTESATLSSVFKMNYIESSSTYNVSIDTSDTGYASIGQEVDLVANTYYKVSYGVNITSISKYSSGKDYYGVFVTFPESKDFNLGENGVMLTEVANGVYHFTFKVAKTGRYTISLKVGDEDHPVKANVTLESFKLAKIKASDAQVNYVGELKPDTYYQYSLFNMFYIIAGGILVLILCYAIYFMYQRQQFIAYPSETETKEVTAKLEKKRTFISKLENNNVLSMVIVICSTLLVSLIANIVSTGVASTYGYYKLGYNLDSLTTQGIFFAKYGPQYMLQSLSTFAGDSGYTYAAISTSPLSVIFVGIAGLLGRIFEGLGTSAVYLSTAFFIRFFATLADVGVVIIIYKLLKVKNGNTGAMLMAILYGILPTAFATSGIWGYQESLMIFFVALAIYFMLKNKYIPTAIAYFVAFMFSNTALLIAPMILFFTIQKCINAVKNKQYGTLYAAISITVLSFFVYYALNVPFTYNQIVEGNAFYCVTRSWNAIYTNIRYTFNAFNFQSLLGNNNGTISTASLIVTIIFILFLLALVGVAYFKYKNRMHLLLLMSAFINMMFVFANGMNPTTIYISLALMLIYAIMNKEKRIFFAFMVFAALMFVNVSYMELFGSYTDTAITYMSANAVSYTFSAIYLVAALYYIYIVYDIIVSKKVRLIKPMPLNYIEWLGNSCKKIKRGYYKFMDKIQKK